ncbi:MAG: RCC1 domain-containing protein, partial [Bacillota bacterium]
MKTVKRLMIVKVLVCLVFAIVICALLTTSVPEIRKQLFYSPIDNEQNITPGSEKTTDGDELGQGVYLSSLNDEGGITEGSSTWTTGYSWQFKKLDSGKFHMLIVDQDNFVFSRGSNEFHQLGIAAGTNVDSSYYSTNNYYTYWQPVVALNHLNVTDVAAGGYHSIAIGYDYKQSSSNASAYKVYTWGRKDYGALGNGQTSGTTGVPQDITNKFSFASGEYPVEVSAGEYHSMLRTNDGRLFTWGHNGRGQLGIGNYTNKSTPVRVTSHTGFTQISAGSMHSLALRTDKRVYTCGDNTSYQLGTTSGVRRYTFASPWTTQYEQISAGELHNGAKRAGTSTYIDLWGCNRGGKLGASISSSYHTNDPYQRSATRKSYSGYKSVSAGGRDTIAINTSNYLVATGFGVDTYYDVTENQRLQNTGMKVNQIYNGGTMAVIVNASNDMYGYGYASHYSENWYADPSTIGDEYANGDQMYNTTPPESLNVTVNSSYTIKRLTPNRNIIGMQTTYLRDNPRESVSRPKLVYDTPRVKINCFDTSSMSDFRVAQVTKDQYDDLSYSDAHFVNISTKGVILEREGYYFVRYYRQGSGIIHSRLKIANTDGPTINLHDEDNKYYPTLQIYDGVGLKSLSVSGDALTYNINTENYSTYDYSEDVSYPTATSSMVYNAEIDIKANSQNTFSVIATDIE